MCDDLSYLDNLSKTKFNELRGEPEPPNSVRRFQSNIKLWNANSCWIWIDDLNVTGHWCEWNRPSADLEADYGKMVSIIRGCFPNAVFATDNPPDKRNTESVIAPPDSQFSVIMDWRKNNLFMIVKRR